MIVGALGWLAVLLAMLRDYPRVSLWLAMFSLIYPVFYTALSIHLAGLMKRRERSAEESHPFRLDG